METAPGQPGCSPWIFVFASIGDCKAFKVPLLPLSLFLLSLSHPPQFDPRARTCTDVTAGNRNNLSDPRDPGGRLGPQARNGGPDLRNLELYSVGLVPGDILLLFSDGVHDNFDPQNLGKMPTDIGLSYPDWDSVPSDIGIEAKNVRPLLPLPLRLPPFLTFPSAS